MQLDRDGAQLFPAAFGASEIAALRNLFATLPDDRPGGRLGRTLGLAPLVAPADAIARSILGPAARAVSAKWFDKSPGRNWSLGWHQDRTIAVRARRRVAGFTGWTVKSGIPHCVPPFGILARMLILRVHLDPAGPANAPLLVAPGSHRLGRVAEADIDAAVAGCGTRACLAGTGDVWACAAPILHASERASAPTRRRVLQLAYGAEDLPGRLEWFGV